MAKLTATCMVLVLVSLGAVGCGPPVPPQRVNAVLPKNRRLPGESQDDCDSADAVVLAQCTQRQEYATTVRGNWERHWYVTRWQVVRVERGQWPHASIAFISYYSWPTPESGILLTASYPAYYKGALMAFCIDTSQHRPTIVAQEERSRIPPHGKPRRPPRVFYDLDKNSIYNDVMAAARRFIGKDRGRIMPRRVVEEYDDFYVVDIGNALESAVVTVDKGSYRVQPVEPAYSDGQPSPSQSQP